MKYDIQITHNDGTVTIVHGVREHYVKNEVLHCNGNYIPSGYGTREWLASYPLVKCTRVQEARE